MTGPTASFSASPALPSQSAMPPTVTIKAPARRAGAPPTLAAFVNLMTGRNVVATNRRPTEHRHDDAATGKPLPDDDDGKTDAALAWLFSSAPIALSVAQPLTAPLVGGDGAPALPGAAVPLPTLQAGAPPIDLPGAPAVPTDPMAAAVKQALLDALPGEMKAALKPVITAVPASAVGLPIEMALPGRLTISPALAAAILIPIAPPLTAAERDKASDSDTFGSPTALTGASLLQPADAAMLIAKPADVQNQALDMGRQDWPQRMIDRIETLRDNANASNTSIRLKPDALGRVDISMRTHADGAVTVRFSAEQPATRTLIADAQPQLAAVAEARGIRLSGTSVDLSGSGAEHQKPHFELQQNSSNTLVAGGEDSDAVDDGRIA